MRWRTAALAALAVLMIVSVAVAANPVKGGSYRGKLAAPQDHVNLTFKVSANGKTVKSLQIDSIVFFCEGGAAPLTVKFKNATVSDRGTFKSTATHKFEDGSVGSRYALSGTFRKRRRATGTLKVTWPNDHGCDGKVGFSAKAG